MLLGMAASWKEEPSRVCMKKGDDSEGELQCECHDPTTVYSIHVGTKGIFIEVWVRIRHLARAAA